MATPEQLKALCFKEDGSPKPQNECRSVMINMLILEDMMDIDAAEDLADKTLRDLNLWGQKPEWMDEEKSAS